MKLFSTSTLFSSALLLCVPFFTSMSSSLAITEPEAKIAGVQTETVIVPSTATNPVIICYTNAGLYPRSISEIGLYYTGADSSTVTVTIANSTYVSPVTWFSITNSSTVMKLFVPSITYWVLPGDSCTISNSLITANTNTIKVMHIEAQ